MSLNVISSEDVKRKAHGVNKSEVLNRQADGSIGTSVLRSETGMSDTNPFSSDKQRKFIMAGKGKGMKNMFGKKMKGGM